MSLNSKLDELFNDKFESDDLDENNVTGGGESYNTPNAFEDEEDEEDCCGMAESQFVNMSKQMFLGEAKYIDYKKDESLSQRQKVNKSIKEVNGKLFRIERIIDQNVKLKTESGIDESKYWESTKKNLRKIETRMMRLAEKLRKF